MAYRPPNQSAGDARYPPRHQSPTRYTDRRASLSYGSGSLASRISDPPRPSGESGTNPPPSNPRDVPVREPPKGPRALFDPPRGPGGPGGGRPIPPSQGPRGRANPPPPLRGGYSNSRDFHDRDRDRDYRDSRDHPPFRGEREHWRDREPDRNRRPSPMGRGRSPPPPRDHRDFPPRDVEFIRGRRDSRDGPLSAGSSSSGDPASAGLAFGRGGVSGRGRGRDDWGFSSRGRGGALPANDRDRLPRARSRSKERDRWWAAETERERDYQRREERTKAEREEREREAERYKRERLASTSEARPSGGTAITPTTPLTANSPHSAGNPDARGPESRASDGRASDGRVADNRASENRLPESRPSGGPFRDYPSSRKTSGSGLNQGHRDARPESEKSEFIASRAEASRDRYDSRAPTPPPQVPAFGSIHNRPALLNPRPNVWRATSPSKPIIQPPIQPITPQGPKAVPTGPKGLSLANPPTGPRSDRPQEKKTSAEHFDMRDDGKDKELKLPHRTPTSPTQSPLKPQPNVWVNPENKPLPHLSTPIAPPLAKPWAPPAPQTTVSRPGSSSSSTAFSGPRPSIPSNVPSGPGRAGSPGGHTAQVHPSQGPPIRPDPSMSPTIPTGPKADRLGIGIGRGRGAVWRGPGGPQYGGRGGMPMGSVPTKRKYTGEEKERPISAGRGSYMHDGPIVFPASRDDDLHKQLLDHEARSIADSEVRQAREVNEKPKVETPDVEMIDAFPAEKQEPKQDRVLEPSPRSGQFPATYPLDLRSDRMDVDGDDDVGMDVDDFKANDERCDAAISQLEAKLQELLTEKEVLSREILEKEEFLNGAGKDMPWESPLPSIPPTLTQHKVNASPSPEDDGPSDSPGSSTTEEDVLQDLPLNKVRTPSIENLPYLNLKQSPDLQLSFSKCEFFRENIANHNAKGRFILDQISQQRKIAAIKQEALKKTYAQIYKPWRLRVDELDEEKRRSTECRDPSVPAPEVHADPQPIIEGRRGGKFSSALELEKVLEESAAVERENRERREREVKARADMDKEAVVPAMLDEFSKKASLFKDTTGLVRPELMLETYRYYPPEDDFTQQEQSAFQLAFFDYPKKWGRVADCLPDRTYKDCIQHYYLTKQKEKYKQMISKRRPPKRRARRDANTQSRSNALMSDLGTRSDLYDGDDTDRPTLAVTDTGRPRRAAAPVFGNDGAGDSEPATPAATPARRNAAANASSEETADQQTEKSTKRSRTAAPKEKGSRKPRNTPLAAGLSPSPQKGGKDKEKEKEKDKEPKIEDEQKLKDLEDAKLLADLKSGADENHQPSPDSFSGQIMQPMPPFNNAVHQTAHQPGVATQRPAPQTSSYWSVPETQDFPKLLAHFGTNWQAIANYMTSKTHIMVKNYFQREVEKGKTEWDETAKRADEKIKRGENIGPPPLPQQPKRHQLAAHRALAPSSGMMDLDETNPRQQPATVMPNTPSLSQFPRFPTLAQAVPAQQSRAPQQRQGPPLGVFPDTGGRPTVQAQPPQPPPPPAQPVQVSQPAPSHHRARFFEAQQIHQARQIQETQPAQQTQQTHQVQQTQQTQQSQQPQNVQQAQQVKQTQQTQQRSQTPQAQQAQTQQAQQAQREQQAQAQRDQQTQAQRDLQSQQLQQLQMQTLQHQTQQINLAPAPQPPSQFTQGPFPPKPAYQPPTATQTRPPATDSLSNDARPQTTHTIPESLHAVLSQSQSQSQHRAPPPVRPVVDTYRHSQPPFCSTPTHSPSVLRAPAATSPLTDEPRAASIPPQGPLSGLPAKETKKSNISTLLNDTPEEPLQRKRFSDRITSAPTPPPQSPQTQIYHQASPIQGPQQNFRRDIPLDQQTSLSPYPRGPAFADSPIPSRSHPSMNATSAPPVSSSLAYSQTHPRSGHTATVGTAQQQPQQQHPIFGQPSHPHHPHYRRPSPVSFASHSRGSSFGNQQQPSVLSMSTQSAMPSQQQQQPSIMQSQQPAHHHQQQPSSHQYGSQVQPPPQPIHHSSIRQQQHQHHQEQHHVMGYSGMRSQQPSQQQSTMLPEGIYAPPQQHMTIQQQHQMQSHQQVQSQGQVPPRTFTPPHPHGQLHTQQQWGGQPSIPHHPSSHPQQGYERRYDVHERR